MKKIWVTLLKMLVFLLSLFATMRIIFLIKYWSLVSLGEIPFLEILKGFWSALPLDIATACFMLALPVIYMFVSLALDKETLFAPLRWFFYLLVAVYNLAAFGDIGIYGECTLFRKSTINEIFCLYSGLTLFGCMLVSKCYYWSYYGKLLP